ncbi:3-oxoacid CoA-transferase subunit A [Pelobacter seleniigenes]|uniref:3-oxoacid CoA-transferase subunit A n=1 Tax=Pelobacter seleniigenes TaxID=407188 RepID=UPI0004A6D2A4|nr:3-oxoacid CoA-transferase subunit A [Pelobacter seleniigenes]
MIEKKIISAEDAAALVKDGDTVMLSGFMACGSPPDILNALYEKGTKGMTLVCNDTAIYNPKNDYMNGVAPLVLKKQFSKMIVSHIGTNPETQRQMNAGEAEVELVPQGTLAEQIRAGGAGLGGILTPTGVGTEVEEGKQVIEVDGTKFLLEKARKGDIALIKAGTADKAGNLTYAKSSRNFGPLMATACKTVVVEVDEIVEVGELDPECIVTPGFFVDYLVQTKGAK